MSPGNRVSARCVTLLTLFVGGVLTMCCSGCANTRALWRWAGDEVRVVNYADATVNGEFAGTYDGMYVHTDETMEDGEYGILVLDDWEGLPTRQSDDGVLELAEPIEVKLKRGSVPYHQLTVLDRGDATKQTPDGPELAHQHYGVEIRQAEDRNITIAVYGEDRDLRRWVRLARFEVGQGRRWTVGRKVLAVLATPPALWMDVYDSTHGNERPRVLGELASLVFPEPGTWDLGHSTQIHNVRVTEYVRSGESLEDWTEMVSFQTGNKAGLDTLQEMFDSHRAAIVGRQPGSTVTLIRKEPTRILYEAHIRAKKDAAEDERIVGVFLDGKQNRFNIYYTVRAPATMTASRRTDWIRRLTDSSPYMVVP